MLPTVRGAGAGAGAGIGLGVGIGVPFFFPVFLLLSIFVVILLYCCCRMNGICPSFTVIFLKFFSFNFRFYKMFQLSANELYAVGKLIFLALK